MNNEEFNNCTLHEIRSGDQIKENEEGGVYSTQVKMRNLYKIIIRRPETKDHSGDLGVDGRIILKFMSRNV